ncbi:TKL protein kinase [Thecamonas trahens ATCC 50062]|uniref:TKL protein kinase n=1 Tax=Thecamonas trahens ATCC 50062 TaxID=461836 RepID=A0A0L0DC33_THETB|nr:TKL protein kinase [Thecamonas trahens ATCC 50062]KNC49902.1 TKL protein kinase [Thecamonas trahens ATCC 50062]|eukprot:XP_013757383.1 TKL protein kinase [Thecamonas trahens ATCC 50062]
MRWSSTTICLALVLGWLTLSAVAVTQRRIIPIDSYGAQPSLRFFQFISAGSQLTVAMREFADTYTAESNGTEVVSVMRTNLNEIDDRAVYEYWLRTIGAPDVLQIYLGAGSKDFINSGHYLDLSEIWERYGYDGDIIEAAADFVLGDDGKPYAIPAMATGNICVYRGHIFDKYNLSPPKTWAELLEVCAVLTANGEGCLGHDLEWMAPTQYFDNLAIRMHGNDFYSQFLLANVSFTDPRIRATWAQLLPLIDRGFWSRKPKLDQPGRFALDWLPHFASGDVTLWCGFDSIAAGAVPLGAPAEDILAFKFPDYHGSGMTVENGPGNNGALTAIIAFGVPINSAFHERALKFVDYMANTTNQARVVMNNKPGIYTPRRSLRDLLKSNRTRLTYEELVKADRAFERSSLGGFGFVEVLSQWQNLTFTLLSMPTASEAFAVFDAAAPQLEAVRLSAVLKQTASPEAQPPSGSFSEPVEVTLTSLTPGAVIYYTIDGSAPSLTSTIYAGPVRLSSSGTITLRAAAKAGDLKLSDVTAASYALTLPVPPPDSGLGLLLAILLPVLACVLLSTIIAGYIFYRRKAVTYKLSSDSDLVIAPEELTLGKAVGAGSYGTVYAGKWRATAVAVKRTRTKNMTPAQLREFVDEASMLLRLRHSNVVIFMGITLEPPQLVTEFMDRGSMYDVLHSPNLFLDPSIVFKWSHNITQGLVYLSHAGVVHGDFKSLNVLFDSSWVPKICDFGMSSVKGDAALSAADDRSKRKRRKGKSKVGPADKAGLVKDPSLPSLPSASTKFGSSTGLSDLSFSSSMTATMVDDGAPVNVGTVFWSAPEVLVNGSDAMTPASDAFSLGITLWELATRADLYPGENALAVALEIVNGRRPSTDIVPAAFSPLQPIFVALWGENVDRRMTLDAAEAALAGLYSPARVVYPTTAEDPSGEILAVHCCLRGARKLLRADLEVAAGALRTFHTMVPEFATELGVSVLAWGLGWVTLAVHRPHQLVSLEQRLTELLIPPGTGVAMVAARGDVEIVESPTYDSRELAGPVMIELKQAWTELFGIENDAFLGDNEIGGTSGLGVSTTPKPSCPPKASMWEKTVPSGLFVTSRSVVTELQVGGKCHAQPLPWKLGGGAIEVFQVVPIGAPTVVDVLARAAGSPVAGVATSEMSASGPDIEQADDWLFSREDVVALVKQSGRSWMGSFATAHEADTTSSKQLVVKTLLRQELNAMDVVQLAELAPVLSVLVPRYDAGTLLDAMSGSSPLVLNAAAMRVVMGDLTAALARLHVATQQAHGSLRPGNVVLEAAGTTITAARIIDFGMDGIKANMGTMTMVPSVAYMSPESLRGDVNNVAGDVFVIGTLLYELISGSAAFSGSNALEVGYRISSGFRPPVNATAVPSDRVRGIISSCWVDDAASRPSMSELVTSIAACSNVDFISKK